MKSILSNADAEYEQSIIRILLGGIVMLYLLIFTPYQSWMAPAFIAFLFVSFFLSQAIKRYPGNYWWRIILGQIIDFGAISIDILMCGQMALPVIGVYLWVIIGNGCRFGMAYLISAITLSSVLFAIVGLNEPFLASHKYLTIGLGISQIIVPFYFAVLLRRLNETRDRLEYLSEFDELTGLLNRRKFDTLLAGEFERLKRVSAPFSVALVDIDHFKQVNDSFGHLAGDHVLKEIAKNIGKSCRSIDSVSRYGGEEFALLLPGLESTKSFSLGERVRKSIESSPISIDGNSCNVTVSIGLASWSDEFEEVEDWIKVADEALYLAKREGRNTVISGPLGKNYLPESTPYQEAILNSEDLVKIRSEY